MARFERSGEKRNKRNGSSKKSTRPSGSYEEYTKMKRDSGRHGRKKKELEMTKVTCSSCGIECEVPFKPTSSKPVYCRECFGKNDKSSSGSSSKDLAIINEKLDKIMDALDI
jgi:CxxC-x17-CxxC domain-containing protein